MAYQACARVQRHMKGVNVQTAVLAVCAVATKHCQHVHRLMSLLAEQLTGTRWWRS
jgi:hypothetical protein